MKAPTLTPVKSSNIESIGFHDSELHVRFKGGQKTYIYKDVPAKLHTDLMASESVGKYFADHVKGKFEHRVI